MHYPVQEIRDMITVNYIAVQSLDISHYQR